ncbi:MAG: hypothetical protein HYY32_01910, partial [Chloroflexi bacterium]|nr:hypothetical protein [Chloroflexota bacterium]
MSTINVVVAANILDEYVRRIEATDNRIRLRSAGPLLRVERQALESTQQGREPTAEQRQAMAELEA